MEDVLDLPRHKKSPKIAESKFAMEENSWCFSLLKLLKTIGGLFLSNNNFRVSYRNICWGEQCVLENSVYNFFCCKIGR